MLCASGELVWVGAGPSGRSGRVALYFRDDAPLIGPPPTNDRRAAGATTSSTVGPEQDSDATAPPPADELLRARLAQSPCFFGDLLAELDLPAEALREALWDLVWAGEATNDAWAPLRAPRLALARARPERRTSVRRFDRSKIGQRRSGAQSQVQGRWSLTEPIFRTGPSGGSDSSGSPGASGPERRRALAELLLERYGIVTREQVLAEGIKGGFAMLYDTFCNLETLGVCRRGYFIEGMGGAQFALPGAVERLRAGRSSIGGAGAAGVAGAPGVTAVGGRERERTLVLAAADPAQPYGAALSWPKREGQDRRPSRVAGAYVVLVADEPALYVERGGRGLLTLAEAPAAPTAARERQPLDEALQALAEAVRAGRVPKLALERIDGQPAIASGLAATLRELGFQSGPRRLTLSA
ncbi:MAG TPA: DEAD/DEAH box helicase, partial [Solirubrobacteraceae bacterium]|nr:DEAD/DEAH box helicase [Solirubrobacteraceae bacterium]